MMIRTLIAVAVFLLSSHSAGFEFFLKDGATATRWDAEKAIPWRLSSNAPALVHEAMEYACLNWSIASAGVLQFAEGDGGILVNWADAEMNQDTPASTVLWLKGSNITSATISINTSKFSWKRGSDPGDALDLDAILLHELGHALGLDHSDNNQANVIGATSSLDLPTMNSIVYPSARTLHLDDIAGIRSLYGIDVALPSMYIEASPSRGRAPLKVALYQIGGDEHTMWDLGNGSVSVGITANARFKVPGFYIVSAESRGMTANIVIEVTSRKKRSRKK